MNELGRIPVDFSPAPAPDIAAAEARFDGAADLLPPPDSAPETGVDVSSVPRIVRVGGDEITVPDHAAADKTEPQHTEHDDADEVARAKQRAADVERFADLDDPEVYNPAPKDGKADEQRFADLDDDNTLDAEVGDATEGVDSESTKQPASGEAQDGARRATPDASPATKDEAISLDQAEMPKKANDTDDDQERHMGEAGDETTADEATDVAAQNVTEGQAVERRDRAEDFDNELRQGDDHVAEADDLTADRIAFDRIFQQHLPVMRMATRRITRNPIDAEDAAQDAALKAWRNRRSFEDRGEGAGGWLQVIAHNAAIDSVKKRDRAGITRVSQTESTAFGSTPLTITSQETNESVLERLRSPEPGPEKQVVDYDDAEYRIEQLVQALDRLDPRFRQALVAIHIDGKTHSEFAEEQGIPYGTSLSRLKRGVNRLMELAGVSPEERGTDAGRAKVEAYLQGAEPAPRPARRRRA